MVVVVTAVVVEVVLVLLITAIAVDVVLNGNAMVITATFSTATTCIAVILS